MLKPKISNLYTRGLEHVQYYWYISLSYIQPTSWWIEQIQLCTANFIQWLITSARQICGTIRCSVKLSVFSSILVKSAFCQGVCARKIAFSIAILCDGVTHAYPRTEILLTCPCVQWKQKLKSVSKWYLTFADKKSCYQSKLNSRLI